MSYPHRDPSFPPNDWTHPPMPTFNTVLNAIKLAGSATPAFAALFESVITTFGPSDQATLQSALAEARAKSDAAHEDVRRAASGE